MNRVFFVSDWTIARQVDLHHVIYGLQQHYKLIFHHTRVTLVVRDGDFLDHLSLICVQDRFILPRENAFICYI